MADHRLDPDMQALLAEQAAVAAKYPPIRLEVPLDPQRAVNDALSMRLAEGGPAMADSADRWVAARGRRIFCRVHRPRADRTLPVLVYFHGGGWVWASVDTHDRLVREYAAGAGVAAVNVDYALSPEARFPQAVEECAAVVRHLVEHGAGWGLDGSRILLGGDSAGGNLALATALLLRDTGGPRLAGVLATYPVCDSRLDTPSYQEFGTGFALTGEKMAFYWSVYVPHAADRLHPYAAPLRAELSGLPPVRVQLAELDVLRSEGEDWWRSCVPRQCRWSSICLRASRMALCAPRRMSRRHARRWRKAASGCGGLQCKLPAAEPVDVTRSLWV